MEHFSFSLKNNPFKVKAGIKEGVIPALIQYVILAFVIIEFASSLRAIRPTTITARLIRITTKTIILNFKLNFIQASYTKPFMLKL